MNKQKLINQIHHLLESVDGIPERIKEDIKLSIPKYSEKDLEDVLIIIIEWDRQLSFIYQDQIQKISELTQRLEADMAAEKMKGI